MTPDLLLVQQWRRDRAEDMRARAAQVETAYESGPLPPLCHAYAEDIHIAALIIEHGATVRAQLGSLTRAGIAIACLVKDDRNGET